MGRGDQFMRPSFTVPMPVDVKDWPFEKRERAYCKTCERPEGFCECPRESA